MSLTEWLIVIGAPAAFAMAYRALGEARLLAIDTWVRRALRAVTTVTLALIRVVGVLILLLACLFGIALLGFLLDSVMALIVGQGAVAALAMLLLVIPLSLYLAYHSLKLQAALTLRFASAYVQRWRQTGGSSPPWPFTWFDKPAPRQRDAFLLMFLLVPVLLVHLVAMIGVVALGVTVAPFTILRSFAAKHA